MTNVATADRPARLVGNFVENPSHAPRRFSRPWWNRAARHTALGLLLLLVNFPQYLRRVIDHNVGDPFWQDVLVAPVVVVQAIVRFLVGGEPTVFFQRAMTISFLLLWLFFALLVFVSIRTRNPRWIGAALLGIIAGFFALHVLAWGAVFVATIIGAAFISFGWVTGAAGTVFSFTMSYFWLIFGAAAIVTLYVERQKAAALAAWFLNQVRKFWPRFLGGVVGLSLLLLLLPAIYRWVLLPIWEWVLAPVFGAIAWVASWIFAIVLVLLLVILSLLLIPFGLALLGSLLISQLQAGWHAGRGTNYMLIAGFAIGSLLTLITLVSIAVPGLSGSLDSAWYNAASAVGVVDLTGSMLTFSHFAMLPSAVENFAFAYLINLQAPAFDSLIFLAILTMGVLSVGARLLSAYAVDEERITLIFVAEEYLKMAAGLFVALVVIFASSISQE